MSFKTMEAAIYSESVYLLFCCFAVLKILGF